jgi:hypothetical protein
MTSVLLTMVWFSPADAPPLWHGCCGPGWTRPTTPSESPAVVKPDPVVPNTSEKNRRLNRRVELTYRPSR